MTSYFTPAMCIRSQRNEQDLGNHAAMTEAHQRGQRSLIVLTSGLATFSARKRHLRVNAQGWALNGCSDKSSLIMPCERNGKLEAHFVVRSSKIVSRAWTHVQTGHNFMRSSSSSPTDLTLRACLRSRLPYVNIEAHYMSAQDKLSMPHLCFILLSIWDRC